MTNITNLNKARKARIKLKKKSQADENVIKSGLSRARKSLEEARAEKAARELDGKQRDE